MKRFFLVAAVFFFLVPSVSNGQMKVIFDTDMAGDWDDCGAAAVLHALADRTSQSESLARALACRPTRGDCRLLVGKQSES